MVEYIKSFTEEALCKFILETKESLFICSPLIQPKVLTAIDELHFNLDGKVSIHIGVDFSPETFRQGYGEIDSYMDIWMTDYQVLNMKDNRISFIISDQVGYYLFFESRYFIPADKATMNAVKIDPVSMVRLKHQFFNSFQKAELTNQLSNAVIEESIQLKDIESEFKRPGIISSIDIDDKIVETVQTNLNNNPPLKPDYKRIVEFYSNKFQYAKLEFNGANLKTKKIELPQKALPIKDAELKKKLESKLNLFDQATSNLCFNLLDKFKSKIISVREDFLTPLKSRNENILEKSRKTIFIEKVKSLEIELIEVRTESLLLVSIQIESTKEKLRKDLIDFYLQYPELISNQTSLFWDQNEDYKVIAATNLANTTIYNIHWPEAIELLNGFSIKTFFSDITFEDLQNEKLIKELLERKLINNIDINNLATFGKAVEVTK